MEMGSKSENITHPYSPANLLLPHYVPNDKSVLELLCVFFGVLSVFIVSAWVIGSYAPRIAKKRLVRLKLCWFVMCGLIHTILEGYFSVFHKTLAGDQAFLSQMWKEYGKGDSRYVSSDTFTVCMETITGAIDGPLAMLAFYAFLFNKPYRHVIQLTVSLCQLYGDVLYFMTEIKDDFIHGEMWHPLYFWFYFIFLNLVWIVVPIVLIMESGKALTSSQAVADRVSWVEAQKINQDGISVTNGSGNVTARKKMK